MRGFFTGLATLCVALVMAGPAWGQLDNRTFTASEPGKIRQGTADSAVARPARLAPAQAGDVRFSVSALTFLRNDEYFNKLVDGIRLLGMQLNPQLVYYPSKSLRLEGGIFLWKDYGNPVLRQVAPTFRGTWTKGGSQFIFGNILPLSTTITSSPSMISSCSSRPRWKKACSTGSPTSASFSMCGSTG